MIIRMPGRWYARLAADLAIQHQAQLGTRSADVDTEDHAVCALVPRHPNQAKYA